MSKVNVPNKWVTKMSLRNVHNLCTIIDYIYNFTTPYRSWGCIAQKCRYSMEGDGKSTSRHDGTADSPYCRHSNTT